MGDLNDFLSAQEPPAPEEAAPDVEPQEPDTPEEPATPPTAEDTPPTGMDRKDQAIWREEREKRKELQRQVEQMNSRWQDMMARMQQPPAAPPQQPPAPEIPSYEEDPLGHLKARNDLLEQQLHQAQQFQSVQVQQAQQAQQFNQLRGTVDSLETQFAQANPDYHDAVGYLYQQVGKMAEAMGYPPEMRNQIVSQTAMDISVRAMQQNRNPAELAYQAARQMGWASQPVQAAELQDTETPITPTPRQKPAPTSLGAVAGRQEAGMPTWDAVAKMDESEFEAFWKKFERQQKGR